MAITKQIVYIGDFYDKAQEMKQHWGKTTLYTTGSRDLDHYFGGGFGRQKGYEIVLLYGDTGIGKSTVALNWLAPAIKAGVKVGLLVLEDDMADVSNRLAAILSPQEYAEMNNRNNVRCLPEDALTRSWKLPDLLEYIEAWFNDGVDLILLDHIQFAFENAESIKGENEYIAQRVFMRSLNQLMKRVNKTIILISHINKAGMAKGMNKIVGSSSIAQASTKVIEVSGEKDWENALRFQLWKSRFTRKPSSYYNMKLIDGRLESAK